MINKIVMIMSILFFSGLLQAGDVSIEKKDSLIRNDIFEQKQQRAEEYKRKEGDRNANNEYWSVHIDPSCGLLKHAYLIYFCAINDQYYQAYDVENQRQYRQLSPTEVKNLHNQND